MKVIRLMILLMVVSMSATAQTDKLRIAATYDDSRTPFTEKEGEVVKGFSVEADFQAFKLGKARASAAYLFQQLYGQVVYPDYYDSTRHLTFDLYRNVRTHYVGAQLGYTLGHAVEPFVGYFVGTNKIHVDANRQVTSKIRAGINVPISAFFVKAAIDFNRSYGTPGGGFVSPKNKMVIIGAGFRF